METDDVSIYLCMSMSNIDREFYLTISTFSTWERSEIYGVNQNNMLRECIHFLIFI